MSGSFPTVINVPFTMTAAGPQPTPLATLYSILLQNATALSPGLTTNLPGTLIEDVASTQVAGLAQADQARVDAVNAVAAGTANPYVLTLLGQQYGIPQGQPTNTSVYVQFTGSGSAGPGYVVAPGFTVGDGTYQYVIQPPGGVIGSGSTSALLSAIATVSGSWTPAANSITQIVTSLPAGYTLTVTNPEAGVAGNLTGESTASYQSRVYQAGQSPANGLSTTLLTNLQAVSGVQARLTALRQLAAGWEVICGGGDEYEVAWAIYVSICDIAALQGSPISSARNVNVTIPDPPNTYNIVFIDPPAQIVTMSVTWNTNLPNYTAGSSVNQLAAPALVNYLNGIQVGQPINLLDATAVFQQAVLSVLPVANLTTLQFIVYVNGVETAPTAGTSSIPGDPESYWSAAANAVTVAQG